METCPRCVSTLVVSFNIVDRGCLKCYHDWAVKPPSSEAHQAAVESGGVDGTKGHAGDAAQKGRAGGGDK